MKVLIQKLPHAADLPLPAAMTAGAAGCDLRAAEAVTIPPHEWRAVGCGFRIALPTGVEAQVRPRSGLAARHGVTVLNAPGTIDADYRGELTVLLINHGTEPFVVSRGDRIAQLVFARAESWELDETDQLPASERGAGGFGHTGR